MRSINFLIVFLLIINSFHLRAQQTKGLDIQNSDIQFLLPPLEKIIDSAIVLNPFVKFRNLQITINTSKLNTDRTVWVKNMGIQTDVRYGTFDNFSTNTAEGQNPSALASRSNQFNYGVGAYMKMPFFDLINRKNQIKLSKAEVEQAKNMAEVQKNELRQSIIKQYNEVVLKQKLLRIKMKFLETSKINMIMVEKQFQNGVIPVSEYARLSEIISTSEAGYESIKAEFINSYMILEEIVGFKFNIKI